MEGVLTATEQKLVNLAILCNPEGLSSVKVNYDKLAERAGLKNAGVARVTFGKARRKLVEYASANGMAPSPGSPTKPSKVTKSPTKPRARKGAKKVQDEVVVDEDPADEEAVKTEVKTEVKAKDDDVTVKAEKEDEA